MSIRTQLISGAVVIGVAFTAGWLVNGWRYGGKLSDMRADHAQVLEQQANAVFESIRAAREEEHRRTEIVEKERDNAINENKALADDVATGRAMSIRLRRELDALRARARSGDAKPANGSPGESSTDTIGLLAELYARMDEAGRDVAEYADQLRIAGLTCEGAYGGVRGHNPLTRQ